ncbi:MAG: hypothetical protein HY909_00885 [Deltaproteobacteria bacterium]|nr:hypothetical protein [Deltaproteobacteria bacterium]
MIVMSSVASLRPRSPTSAREPIRCLVLVAVAVALVACSDDSPAGDAGRRDDLGGRDAPAVDAPLGETTITPDAAPSNDTASPPGDSPDAATPCRSDRECSARGLVCDRSRGACVECVSVTDCAGSDRACRAGACVMVTRCTSSRMCPGQVCAPMLGYCVDCVGDVDCPAGQRCRANACVAPPRPCRSDRECSDVGLVCDAARGHCVECAADTDCALGQYCGAEAACVARACMPGAAECLDVARRRACDARGIGWTEAPCGAGSSCRDGRCQTRVCAPGSASCASAGERRVCDADGLGYTATACASGESCVDGACTPRACAPGAASCAAPTARRVCNADGLGFTTTVCAAMQSCRDGACLPWTCTPGVATCTPTGQRQLCDADGLGATTTACAAMQTCRDGACRPWSCEPGGAVCADARSVRVCSADGFETRVVPCADGMSCSAGRCAGWVCTPGEASCAATGERRVCNADGLGYTTVTCAVPPRAAAARCDRGGCVFTCEAGYGDCDNAAANGCEAALLTSAAHCGACGRSCAPRPSAAAACAAGACTYACSAGSGDCNGAAADGCETALATNRAHCGACGRACTAVQECVDGACVRLDDRTFRIQSLGTTGCSAVEHVSVTGDDRGGIAVSTARVFYTGDTSTGAFALPDLSGGTSLGRRYEAITGNLRGGAAFLLAIVGSPEAPGGATVDGLFQIDAVSGELPGTRVALSRPITVGNPTGIFAGYDRIVLLTLGRAWNIDLPTGAVTDLGAMAQPPHTSCESWAYWGVAEFFDGAVHVAYVRDNGTIVRQRVPDGAQSTVGSFANLSDMCSFTVSLANDRWYFHHEGASQFRSGDETIGFCPAAFSTTSSATPCTPGTSTCVDLNTARVCAADGGGAYAVRCGAAASCRGTGCTDWLCTPGAGMCASGTERRTCTDDGQGFATAPCPLAPGAAAARCAREVCGFTCRAGLGDCNGAGADGCEATLATSAAHCGACGNACPPRPNAAPACAGGVCGFTCAVGYADCDGAAANGCEVSTARDPAHCGGCGRACPAPPGGGAFCSAGVCLAAPRCNTAPARVLVYGPTGGGSAVPRFPAGTVSTVASEAMWRAMTTRDFGDYDLLWIDNGGCTVGAALFSPLVDSQAQWGPAVRGRIALNGFDATFHSQPGAVRFVANHVTWGAGLGRNNAGGATGLYFSWGCAMTSRVEAPNTSSFAPTLGSGFVDVPQHCTDLLAITAAGMTHPVLAGINNATALGWGCSGHSAFSALPSGYTPLVTRADGAMPAFVVVRDAACAP